MINFRPHRGSLKDSMNEVKVYDSKDDMFNDIVSSWNGSIAYEDLSVSKNYGKDKRIDWKETRYVCTSRVGDEEFNTPQCIGMCSIE